MTAQNDQEFPQFVLCLTASAESVSGETPLSEDDIDKLPCVAKCLNALRKFLPEDLASETSLRGAAIILRAFPSDESAPDFGVTQAHERCGEVVNALTKTAGEVRANATLAQPLPLAKAVTLPTALPLLKALAGASEDSLLEVELVAGNVRRTLPILEMVDFSAGDEGEKQTDVGEHRIKGLIRGNQREPHQLILVSGSIVNLPASVAWAWERIHDVLEIPTWLVGTLTRTRDRGPWSIGDDIQLRRSSGDIFAVDHISSSNNATNGDLKTTTMWSAENHAA